MLGWFWVFLFWGFFLDLTMSTMLSSASQVLELEVCTAIPIGFSLFHLFYRPGLYLCLNYEGELMRPYIVIGSLTFWKQNMRRCLKIVRTQIG